MTKITGFTKRNRFSTAREVIDRTRRFVLSERDTERVLRLLESPPKPPPALLAAVRRRGRHV
jgi:uncharacterized protein (DUF1778 family)